VEGQSLTSLRQETERLKAENAMLASQVKELRLREKGLSERLRTAEFVSRQQKTQIELLADAVRERDSCRAACEKLQSRIEGLQKRVAELEGRGELHAPPSSQPAGPASRPSQ
jgi:chromosome segregation ATPase